MIPWALFPRERDHRQKLGKANARQALLATDFVFWLLVLLYNDLIRSMSLWLLLSLGKQDVPECQVTLVSFKTELKSWPLDLSIKLETEEILKWIKLIYHSNPRLFLLSLQPRYWQLSLSASLISGKNLLKVRKYSNVTFLNLSYNWNKSFIIWKGFSLEGGSPFEGDGFVFFNDLKW